MSASSAPLVDQLSCLSAEELDDPVRVGGSGQGVECFLVPLVGLEPRGSFLAEPANLGRRRRPALANEPPHERVQRVPVACSGRRRCDESSSSEPGKQLVGTRQPERLAEVRSDPVEHGHDAEQLAALQRLTAEDLLGEVRVERPASPGEGVEEPPMLARTVRGEELGRELDGRGPSAARLVEAPDELGLGRRGHEVEARCRLVCGERQVAARDVQNLTSATHANDRERDLMAGREHQVKLLRCVAHEALHEPHRGRCGFELVQVVDDEDDVLGQAFLEGMCDDRRKRVGGRVLVPAGAHRQDGLGQGGEASPQGGEQALSQRRGRAVAGIDSEPRPLPGTCASSELRRLPVAGARDDDGQPIADRLVEPAFEGRSLDDPGWEPRRDELDEDRPSRDVRRLGFDLPHLDVRHWGEVLAHAARRVEAPGPPPTDRAL
jgi:hypothetical protein